MVLGVEEPMVPPRAPPSRPSNKSPELGLPPGQARLRPHGGGGIPTGGRAKTRSAPGSLPPRRRPGSPGRCPSTARRGRGAPRARAGGGSTGARTPGSPVSGGIVIRPRTSPASGRNSASSSGSTPAFVGSPERLTSTSTGIVRRRAADSESSEWTSSQIPFTSPALFDWRWPMKCQRNALPYSACLAARSWARFSPTTSIPASASTAISSRATYLVAATMVTAGPSSSFTAR